MLACGYVEREQRLGSDELGSELAGLAARTVTIYSFFRWRPGRTSRDTTARCAP